MPKGSWLGGKRGTRCEVTLWKIRFQEATMAERILQAGQAARIRNTGCLQRSWGIQVGALGQVIRVLEGQGRWATFSRWAEPKHGQVLGKDRSSIWSCCYGAGYTQTRPLFLVATPDKGRLNVGKDGPCKAIPLHLPWCKHLSRTLSIQLNDLRTSARPAVLPSPYTLWVCKQRIQISPVEPDEVIMNSGVIYLARKEKKKKRTPPCPATSLWTLNTTW